MAKKLTKKAAKLLRTDVLVSVALASLLFNVFFFVGVLVFSSTNQLDRNMYDIAFSNLCDKNYTENLNELMEQSDVPELTKLKFEAQCFQGDFVRYYQNALEAYISDQQ